MRHYSYSKSSFDTVLTPDKTPSPVRLVVAACGVRRPQKDTPRDFEACILCMLSVLVDFRLPWIFFSKSGQSDQMTMPARRASKFSAKRRALLPEVFFQSLISRVIPGIIEPWPECQPEHSMGMVFD